MYTIEYQEREEAFDTFGSALMHHQGLDGSLLHLVIERPSEPMDELLLLCGPKGDGHACKPVTADKRRSGRKPTLYLLENLIAQAMDSGNTAATDAVDMPPITSTKIDGDDFGDSLTLTFSDGSTISLVAIGD